MFQPIPDTIDNSDGVAPAALLKNWQVHGVLPVDAHNVGLKRGIILHFADIGHHQLPIPHRLERHSAYLCRRGKLRVGIYVEVPRPDAHITRRQNGVGRVHGAHHIHRAQFIGLQLLRVHINLYLSVLATKGLWNRCSGNTRKLVAYVELSQVVQLSFIQPFAIESNQANRQARGIELEHDRRQCARRKSPQLCHRQIRDRGNSRISIRARLKVDSYQAHARQGSRFNVINAAAQCEEALERIRNVGFNLFWRHAVVKRSHNHNRNLDLRK